MIIAKPEIEILDGLDYQEMLRLIDARSTDGIEQLMQRHLYGGIRRLGSQIFTKYADCFVDADGSERNEP